MCYSVLSKSRWGVGWYITQLWTAARSLSPTADSWRRGSHLKSRPAPFPHLDSWMSKPPNSLATFIHSISSLIQLGLHMDSPPTTAWMYNLKWTPCSAGAWAYTSTWHLSPSLQLVGLLKLFSLITRMCTL